MDKQLLADRFDLEPNQRQLLAALRAQGIAGRTVLDIGCGTGHLHHVLLDEGAVSVVGVELHGDLLDRARELARELGHEDRVVYLEGDFTELTGQIEPADITILDKVVHCYDDPERLVQLSTAYTRRLYALSFPQDSRRMKFIIRFLGPVASLFLPYRTRFTHPDVVRGWVREAGFERTSHDETEEWITEVYVRGVEQT
jgi:magnesium-protoporphyrin O-methyltransferase